MSGELIQWNSFSPGELIAGRFRIVNLIGRGGMGEVYEAEDLELRERIALKTVLAEDHEEPNAARRFRREVQLARKVTHPNVCRVFDVFRHPRSAEGGDVTFVTMELLTGETLEEHLAAVGTMSEAQAEPLVLQMAEALAAAHRAGIVHRDFKPSNVMLAPTADNGTRVVVTDFGLARAVEGRADNAMSHSGQSRSGDSGMIVGSVNYMAPEQAKAEEVSPATDVYALGMVMFEMVTAAKPHSAGSPAQALIMRVCEPAPSPRTFKPDLDPTWEEVIVRCLKRLPGDRFANAGELIAAFAQASVQDSGQVAAVAEQPPPEKRYDNQATLKIETIPFGPRWRFRVVSLAALGLLAIVLLAVGLLYLLLPSTSLSPFSPRSATSSLPAFDAMQLTTSPGLDIDPTFDPAGDTLAFSSDRGGDFEIYVKELTEYGPARRLTDDGQRNFQPAWSPDGLSIAYYSASRGGIFIVEASGGSPRQVSKFGSQPSFSPDGKYLALQSEGKAGLATGSGRAMPPSTIWIVELGVNAAGQVTSSGQPPGGHGVPTWSPDSQRLVFTTYAGRRSEIWSVGIDGSGPVLVVGDLPGCYDPVFLPDGRILYSAVAEGERDGVWSVAVSSRTGQAEGAPIKLPGFASMSVRQLAISADGNKLAYTALGTSSNLWSLPLAPETGLPVGEPVPLTFGSGRNNRPAFSPDGSRIAYDTWRAGVNRDIWLVDADGDHASRLSVDDAEDSHASWFPAADRVAFLSRRDRGWALWSRHLDSGEVQRLGEFGPDVGWAQVSPDGRRVAYHTREGSSTFNLWTANIDGSDRQRLTDDQEYMGYPCWSPDGSFLAFEAKRGQDAHIMLMPSAGGEVVQLTRGPGQNWPNSWSPDGDRIAFSGQRDGIWNIWWVSRSTGELGQLTSYQRLGAYVRYPAWSPRGDQIVFELSETIGDIWLVDATPGSAGSN